MHLYKDACDAETDAIEAIRKEISCWCFYAKEYENMYKVFMINNRVGEKKAKGKYTILLSKNFQTPSVKHYVSEHKKP